MQAIKVPNKANVNLFCCDTSSIQGQFVSSLFLFLFHKLKHLFEKHAVKTAKRNNLRWLTRVFPRLNSVRYHCLPHVSVNRTCKNDAINPKKKRKPLQHLKGIKCFQYTVEPRLSGPRLSGLFDYPDFFLWSQFFHEY